MKYELVMVSVCCAGHASNEGCAILASAGGTGWTGWTGWVGNDSWLIYPTLTIHETELDDFYAPHAIPAVSISPHPGSSLYLVLPSYIASQSESPRLPSPLQLPKQPYRLSTLSNNSLPRLNSSSISSDLTSIHKSRSTASMSGLTGDSAGYQPVDSSELFKESYIGALPPPPSSSAHLPYYDPQGKSAARYQASRRQQEFSQGLSGDGAGAGSGSGTGTTKKSKKWMIWLIVAIIAIGVIVGVAVGVTVSKKNKNNSTSNLASGSTTTTGDGTGTGTGTGTSSNGSSFANDTRLHNSFYGIAYTPQVGFGSGG